IPYTLYPIPYTLYPIPYTLYPIPYTLYPIPYIYPIYTLYPIPLSSHLYSYDTVQAELDQYDTTHSTNTPSNSNSASAHTPSNSTSTSSNTHTPSNILSTSNSTSVSTNSNSNIFYQRELVTRSLDGRRIDLITITSPLGLSSPLRYEPLLSGLFPEAKKASERPPLFDKEIVFISARVHAGEVPAQHTFKGILDLLMDPNDLQAQALRARYVFKLIPVLNPDGVYRGHFRMDQLGNNLNRYYLSNDSLQQPSIFAAKSLTDHYAAAGKLCVYLDFHAHASKRGCFIYGNVLDSAEDQIQNQLYCKLASLNSAHFDYEGCLFSKDHMTRIDPGDQAKGLTAEGSGRVSMYLAHKMIHSYTIECNYNSETC
ncbi:hypothetical protein B484DRAFT_17801, partial [Ochromonadaceae sp. CCMP2298]